MHIGTHDGDIVRVTHLLGLRQRRGGLSMLRQRGGAGQERRQQRNCAHDWRRL
jgi:hypothetical protein